MARKKLPIKVVLTADDKASRKVHIAMRKISRASKAATRGIQKTVKIMGVAAVAAVALTKKMIDPALRLEDALATVKTVAAGTFGSIEKDMEAVEKAARSWSKEHTDAADNFTTASYQMISAGLDTRQAIEGTRTALAVAKATMGDAALTANALATVYNTLGDRTADVATEMTRVGDVLVRTQQFFQLTNIDQLTAGMQLATPIALQYGISLEQVTATIGQLNTLGLQGSRAGTAFASAMSKMNEASEQLGFQVARSADGNVDFLKTIENLRKKLGDKMHLPKVQIAMKKAFGEEGIRAVALLLEKTDDLSKGIDEVTNSTGAMARAQKIMESTTTARWTIIKNKITDVSFVLLKDLMPILKDFEAWFEENRGEIRKVFLEGFRDVIEALKFMREHIDEIVIVAKALAVVWIAGKLVLAFQAAAAAASLVGAGLATSLGPPLAIIAGIVAGLKAIEIWQKRGLEKQIRKGGVTKIFRGAAGKAAMEAWTPEPGRAAAESLSFEQLKARKESKQARFLPTQPPVAVGGEVVIKVVSDSPGTRVESVATENKNVPIRVDVGRTKMATGAL